MHELSIATALLELVARNVPPGSVVRRVTMEAGPLRGVEPSAMQWAWQSARAGTACEGAELTINLLPWSLRCPACGNQFTAQDVYVACPACNADGPLPQGNDDLRLMSIDVDVPDAADTKS